jgi:hypothetical protein
VPAPRQLSSRSSLRRNLAALAWLVVESRRSTRLAYLPRTPSLVRTEVQRLDRHHVAVNYGSHAHEFFEIVLFDQVGGSRTVSGRAEEIRKGQAWMLPPGTAHDLSSIGEATGWLVLLGPEQLGLADAAGVIQPWLAQPLVVPFQNRDTIGRPVPLQLTAPDDVFAADIASIGSLG